MAGPPEVILTHVSGGHCGLLVGISEGHQPECLCMASLCASGSLMAWWLSSQGEWSVRPEEAALPSMTEPQRSRSYTSVVLNC